MALESRRPSVAKIAPPQITLSLRKLRRPSPLPSRWIWVRGGTMSSRGGCVKATIRTANPSSSNQPVKETPKQPIVTATRRTARSKKPEHKPAAGPKPATAKPKKKAGASVKSATGKPTTTNLLVTAQLNTSPLEDISDILDHLPLQACMELIRLLLMSMSSTPTAEDRPRASLKTVILFVTEYGSTP